MYNERVLSPQTELPRRGQKFRGWQLELCRPAVQHPGMNLLFRCLLAATILQPLAAPADEASQRAAAATLLSNMEMEKVMSQSVDQMLQMQVQQNPAIAPYQAQIKAFLTKHMSWEAMKDDMAKIYAAEFTEPELKELNAFYQTPLGKKTLQKMPTLLAKGAEIGQKRVQEHLPELQAAIQTQSGGKKTP